jgi:mannose-6-phosphate isomerase-like protein (cupin superfamily)
VVNSPIEQVHIDGRIGAIIVRNEFRTDGIQFVTPADFSQQLGFMRRPTGYQIQPHIHKHVERETTLTQEVLYVRLGRVRVDFYGDDETFRESREIRTGDVILLSAGGHGFEMLEDSELIEVKQGPYLDDKQRFTPSSGSR